MSETVSLRSLLVPSKAVEVDFPGFDGFKLNLSFMSRDTLISIRKKATKTTFKGRQTADELDDKLFLKLYTEAAIKGWSGFKFAYLEQLAPAEIADDQKDDLLPFSVENAVALMESSQIFDNFISETVSDLSAFSKGSSQK